MRPRCVMPDNGELVLNAARIDSGADATFGLLEGLAPSSSEAFLSDMTVTTYQPGQIVVEQGETTDAFYLVLSGRLVGQLVSDSGKEVAFTEIGPGRHFGELAALDGQPRSITISASEQSRLGEMRASIFRAWVEKEPKIGLNLALALAESNRRLTERIFGLVVHDVDKRVRALLSRQAQMSGELKPGGVLQPALSHDEMATYVGANREAVSRVIARLASEGIVESGRRKIILKDIGGLLTGL